MKIPSTINFLLCLMSVFLWECQSFTIPEKITPSYALTDALSNNTQKSSLNNCILRYKLINFFAKLDNQIQEKAVKDAFDSWQQSNKKLYFLKFDVAERTELQIKFVAPSEINKTQLQSPVGLFKASINNICMLKKSSNSIPVILLDNSYDWTEESIRQAVSYQIGAFLGMNSSSDINSIMYPFLTQRKSFSETDKQNINQLYDKPCTNSNFSFLPFTVPISVETKKDIILDKQGTVSIEAKGTMIVGFFVGASTPDGKDKGYLDITIPTSYNIDPRYLHAALLYKIDNDTQWSYCGSKCEFDTKGRNTIQLIFNVNDNDKTDNSGAYSVTVKYK